MENIGKGVLCLLKIVIVGKFGKGIMEVALRKTILFLLKRIKYWQWMNENRWHLILGRGRVEVKKFSSYESSAAAR